MLSATGRMSASMAVSHGAGAADLSLVGSLDRMVEAARQAASPSSLWLSGIVYQGFSLGWTFGITVALPLVEQAMPDSSPFKELEVWGRKASFNGLIHAESIRSLPGGWVIVVLLMPVFFRLVSGLAMIAPSRSWRAACRDARAPSLRQAWRNGHGLWRSTCGLWIQVVLMMFAASLLFIGPTRLVFDLLELNSEGAMAVLATGVCIALVVFYGFVLTVLFQISLHSLVQNRRGVGSALLHAWRIAKNDPLATVRATLLDAILYTVIWVGLVLYVMVLGVVGSGLPKFVSALLLLPAVMVEAWTGCARCYFWARSYQALGGISTRDNAPGG